MSTAPTAQDRVRRSSRPHATRPFLARAPFCELDRLPGDTTDGNLRITPRMTNLRVLVRQVCRKVIEHAELVVVQVGDSELAQAPRLILRL